MDLKSFAASLLVLNVFFKAFADGRKDEIFHVKPGAGTLSVEHEVDKYKCTFTYAAQGGTHEEWAFSMEVADSGAAAMCSVERGIPSYIYFESFKLELTGPYPSRLEVDVKSSQRDKQNLSEEEYTVEKRFISSVPGKFKNHLEKVTVYSTMLKEDL